jgi:general L-amino acid transport system permease protein
VALWFLSLPVVYLVVQRDPTFGDVPVLTMVIPFAAGFAIFGAAYMWWAGSPHEGEAPKIVSALLVLASIGIWFTPLAMLSRFLLLALTVLGLAASTFGGTARGRNGLVGAWIAVDLFISYFMAVSMGATGIPIQGNYIGGLNLTFLLAIAGIALAFPLGILLALGRTSTLPIFRLLSTGYIEVIRGVPMITMLFFGTLVINRFLPADVGLDIVVAVIIAIAMFAGAYLAENVRGGLQSIPKGQREAAQALGLTTVQMTVLITLPQALRAVIPAIVGQVITMFKDTSLVSIVGLAEFLRIAQKVVPNQTGSLGSLQESLLFAVVVYWVFSFGTSRASMRLEKKLGVGER